MELSASTAAPSDLPEMKRLRQVELELKNLRKVNDEKDRLLEVKNRQLKECAEKIRELEGKVRVAAERKVVVDRVTGLNNYVRAFCEEISDFVRKVKEVGEEEEEEMPGLEKNNEGIPEAHMERVLAQIRKKMEGLKTGGKEEVAGIDREQLRTVQVREAAPPPDEFERTAAEEDNCDGNSELGGIQIVGIRSLSQECCKTAEEEVEEEEMTRGDVASPPPRKHARDPKNPLRCICGHTTTDKYYLTQHIKNHVMERQFRCKKCSKKFPRFSYLRSHILLSHKDKKAYQAMQNGTGCSKCGMSFPNVAAFKTHRRNSLFCRYRSAAKNWEPRPAVTPKPSVVRRNGSGEGCPRRRVGASRTKKFACTLCPQAFKILYLLKLHQKRVHKIAPKGFEIGCVDCGLTFNSRVEHRAHRTSMHNTVYALGRGINKKHVKNEDKSSSTRMRTAGNSPSETGVSQRQDGYSTRSRVHKAGKGADGRPRCSCGQLFLGSGAARRHVRLANQVSK